MDGTNAPVVNSLDSIFGYTQNIQFIWLTYGVQR